MPSILIPDDEPPTPSPRLQRLSRRKQEFDEPDLVAIGVQQEVVIEEKEEAPSLPQATPDADSFIKNPFSKKCSIENFKDNPDAISYYTGFSDFDQFMTFFYCLGPCVDELDYKCSVLESKDQLFLTLMKLRQAKEDFELSPFFVSFHVHSFKNCHNVDNFFVFSTERTKFLALCRYCTRFYAR